jgi:Domain of unknown function (DUF1857)
MTIIFAAGTVPVNPAGVTRPLSIVQLWKGLELKVRKPQLFLKVIEDCTVLQDTGDTVLRELVFKNRKFGFTQQSVFDNLISILSRFLSPSFQYSCTQNQLN